MCSKERERLWFVEAHLQAEGGMPVTIHGVNFVPASTVAFDGIPATGVQFVGGALRRSRFRT
jgi:hypothetical protein